MTMFTPHSLLDKSFLHKDLPPTLLEQITLFLTNTNLDKFQQVDLVKILEEVNNEGYAQGVRGD